MVMVRCVTRLDEQIQNVQRGLAQVSNIRFVAHPQDQTRLLPFTGFFSAFRAAAILLTA